MSSEDSDKPQNMKSLVNFSVDSWSSYSENYCPENLLLSDNVTLMNRWCADIGNGFEHVILRLERLVALKTLTFVKKACPKMGALKQFDIFGSYDKKDWFKIHHGCSDFNQITEHITLTVGPDDYIAPVKYVKFVILSGWSYSTNISVWPFYLSCYDDEQLVNDLLGKYLRKKSNQDVIECLSKLRTLDNQTYYLALKNSFPPDQILLIDQLYLSIVFGRNFPKAIEIIDQFSKTDAFHKYYNNIEHTYEWIQLQQNGPYQQDGTLQPKIRGGHQICLLPEEEKIYLFGGWDGDTDVGDMWVYHIKTNKWELICVDSSLEGGPTPRSCHQMCIDRKRKLLYVLGRFRDFNDEEIFINEFFVYDIERKTWTNLDNQNFQQFGPPLCFGHQMCYCDTMDYIILFGGNILSEKHYSTKFGYLYYYNVKKQTWRKLVCNFEGEPVELEPRSDHSMHIDEEALKIIITSGNRGANSIDEFCIVDMNTGDVTYLNDIDSQCAGAIPKFRYTMRSNFNASKKEMYLFSGLERYKNNQNASPSSNSLYVYDLTKNRWSCIYENKHTGIEYWSKYCNTYPVPRFAFQTAYNPNTNINYLFGGNPGQYSIVSLRLNDLWACKINKPTEEEVYKKMKDLVYSEEICLWASDNPISACLQLRDKQTVVNKIINQSEEKFQDFMWRIIDHYDPKEDYYKFENNHIRFNNNTNNPTNLRKQDQNLQHVFKNLSPYFEFENTLDTIPH